MLGGRLRDEWGGRGRPEPQLGVTGVLPLMGGSKVTQVTTDPGEDLCVTSEAPGIHTPLAREKLITASA